MSPGGINDMCSPCSGDASHNADGGGGGALGDDREVAEALRSIAGALSQMQEAMKAMNCKMERTDDTIRCVSQRLRVQGEAMQGLHARMSGLEEKACERHEAQRTYSNKSCSTCSSWFRTAGQNCYGCLERGAILGKMLLKAAQKGKVKYVRHLLAAGADVNYCYQSKWTPLHVATAKTHDRVVELLLEHGADADVENMYGFTALHIAAFHDYSSRCALHLLRAGADANCRNRSGRTPLHYAAESGNVLVVRALKMFGAEQNSLDDRGCSPFDVAKTVCVRRLLRPFNRLQVECGGPTASLRSLPPTRI